MFRQQFDGDELVTAALVQRALAAMAADGASPLRPPKQVYLIDHELNAMRQAQRALLPGSVERRALARAEGSLRRNRARRRVYVQDLSRRAASRNYRCPQTLKSEKHPPTSDREQRGRIITDHFS